jgi:methyl-accepting chemotaxis protein
MLDGYKDLNLSITKTLDLIENVTSASREQEKGLSQITGAINSLDTQTQKNAQTASQTHDIARETLDIASVVLSNTQNKVFE